MVDQAWHRLAGWCQHHAPATFDALRPPAGAPILTAAEAAFARRWPDDLRAWYALQDGAEPASASTPLPDWRILPLQDMREAADMFADGFFDRADLEQTDREPAGTPASSFAPSFVPIGDNVGGCYLFVDCRPGPRSGCVMEWDRDDAATREPAWSSVTAMLDEVATCLETGSACRGWRPTVADVELIWQFDVDSAADDPWAAIDDLIREFRSAMCDRGEPDHPLIWGGRDWSEFQHEVVENIVCNVVYNRVPACDWPRGQLDQLRRDFADLRAVLPGIPAAERPFFELMARIGDATLTAATTGPMGAR